MTTVQTMLTRAALPRAIAPTTIALVAVLMTLSGCAPKGPGLTPPDVLVAPYNSAEGDVLWAVAPLANESGASFVDANMVADQIVAKIDEVRGIACLPMNRTIAAMRARGMTLVTSPQEARTLAETLGVDGLIVGTITAYDPYNPPKLGVKLALFARNAGVDTPRLDPLRLQIAYTEFDRTIATQYLSKPVATVSQHLDASNHEVQLELRRYATGRHDPDSALGWKAIMQSMDLYTQFSAFVAVSRLIDQERLRVARTTTTDARPASP
ncbi:MAG TPA: hypothetical protein PKE29_05565 [Phycisphaerales bacterium]|nr:hypothetical protein [Phycisphaerales bacterium]